MIFYAFLTKDSSATALFWCSADTTSGELVHAHDMGKPILDMIFAGGAMFWVLLDSQWVDPAAPATTDATTTQSVKLIRLSPTQVCPSIIVFFAQIPDCFSLGV